MLFFLISLFFGLLAWNLHHPNFNHPRLALLSFAFGMPTGELAPHVILLQALVIAFFILIGSVSGFFGTIGYLICVGAWAAMALHYYEGSRADREAEQALVEGLGKNYRNEINKNFRDRVGTKPDWKLIRRPFARRDPEVEYIRNIHFGEFGQRLDIRRLHQAGGNLNRPVLLHIHGGAWTYGKKDDGQGIPLMNHMAKRNWICVSSSYRLSPGATFPDQIIDCKQALVWIKDHIQEYGGDPNFVVVTGGSAGGHLAALLALSHNQPRFQPGFEDRDTSVQGAVPFYGVYDLMDEQGLHHHGGMTRLLEKSVLKLDLASNEDAFREASPANYISGDAPPMLVIHGELDTMVPIVASRVFVEALRKESSNKVALLEVSQAQHAFDLFPSPRSEYVKFGVERFLIWNYSQYLKTD